MGSSVVEGEAIGIVVSTGNETVVGKITRMATANTGSIQPAVQDINRFVLLIVIIALSTGIIIVVIWGGWLNRSYNGFLTVSGIISSVIGVIVAFIPEGLPVCVTCKNTPL